MTRRHLTESRVLSVGAEEAAMKLVSGLRIHIHAGQKTDTKLELQCLGGMLISNRRTSPRLTASSRSQIAPMCQLSTNGDGSAQRHIWRTNSCRLRSASSWSSQSGWASTARAAGDRVAAASFMRKKSLDN